MWYASIEDKKEGGTKMKKYMNPEIEVEKLLVVDVITTSNGDISGEGPED